MVDRAKLLERLMATFVDEVSEHVESINSGVLELESQSDDAARQETLTVMFRAAHSLKGASRAVDVQSIESVCHHLEDVFSAIRDGSLDMTPEVGSAILATSDAIASAGEVLRARKPIDETHFADLPDRLQKIVSVQDPVGETEEDSEQNSVPNESQQTAHPPDQASIPASSVPFRKPEVSEPYVPVSTADESRKNAPRQDEPPKTESEATAASQSPTPRRGLGTTVRVAEEKLDSLMAQAGELLVARQQIEIRPREIEASATLAAECRTEFQSIQRELLNLIQQHGHDPLLQRSARLARRIEDIVEQTGEKLRHLEDELAGFQQRLLIDSRQLNHTSEALQEDIHRIRMLPFGDGCAGLDRVVRDTAQATGKKVEFKIEGADIEVDRTVLDGLRDPLLHLIRNSIDHGLETCEDRVKTGKPEAGQVRLSATLRGSQVDITVSDDGQGLDRDAILNQLRSKGFPEPRDEQELYRSIFLPGFSTAAIVTDLSGRGVGLDVVKSQLESLHGTIDLSSQPGFGTRFSLSVPLTLTTISALFVRAGGQIFALPSTNVSRLVRFTAEDVKSMGSQNVLPLGESPVPVTTLMGLLDLQVAATVPATNHLTGVVLTTGNRELVVVVDELINEREAVVKNLGPQIRRIRHLSGATLLRSGGVALLLNVATLVSSQSGKRDTLTQLKPAADSRQVSARRVLVVDDSVTTRSLMKGILESAGYDVTAAVDGQDAWKRLQNSDIELVVSDVDMPNMDGFSLTSQIRKSESFEHLPVVLVTSRDTDEDKARGVEAGANAYLVKSSFQQSNVLDTIGQLL